MKKITLLSLIIINSLFLSGCLPAIQSASTLSTAITITNDRRTAGEVLDDRTIAFKLFAWPSTDDELSESHLNFMVYDKTVLITGETPSNALRKYAASQTKAQDAIIKRVLNEITVGPNSGLLNRAKDAAITAQVEVLFHNQEVFHPTHVRVMTENQTVYLMGAVTKREADKAVTAAAKAKWVKKVVKLFNYLKTRPAAEVERDRQRELVTQKKSELKKQQSELDAKKSVIKQHLRALGGNAEGAPY
jgi:osmotically-inducible protein OsmY